MTGRLRLFGKIFIGFWLATLAVLASWMLANQYFDSRPGGDPLARRPPGCSPARRVRGTAAVDYYKTSC